jgi:C4-dicarboxylate transporter DctM subunit
MKPKDYLTVTLNTAKMLGTVLPILAIASSLNNVLELEGTPKQLVGLMQQYIANGWVMMIAINVLLLAVGCLMEAFSAIIIFSPILLPIVTQYGFDPVHFGIIMIVNLEIGYLTPPVGLNAIVGSVAFREPLGLMVRAVVPFVALLVAALAIVVAFAPLSLWLVRGSS